MTTFLLTVAEPIDNLRHIMRLRTWRKGAKLTQAQLADQLGCTQAHVWQIEVGRKMPSDSMLDKIAAATEGKVTKRDFQRHRRTLAAAEGAVA